MIRVKVREQLEAHRRRTGERLTYEELGRRAGLSIETIQSLAARKEYNTTLETVDRLCLVLGCEPGDLLERESAEGELGS